MTRKYIEYSSSQIFLRGLLGIPVYFWLFAIGTELALGIPEQDRPPSYLLKALAGYPVLYVCVFFACLLLDVVNFRLVVPFHLAAMASTFLLFVFVARTFVRFEKHHRMGSATTLGLFFRFWYWPLGVWSIQPRLNRYARLLP